MFKYILFIWLMGVISVSFLFPITPEPQHWYELPSIPGLEDKARILFYHVPLAWTAVVAFIVSMAYGINYLRTRQLEEDVKSATSANIGLLFCTLATITGSIWAFFDWGSFWNWDPRQTSIFILLLIYGAYFALRSALDADEQRATLSAVYVIIAGVTVPFFVFIMPRMVSSLHPEPIVNVQGEIYMNSTMLVVFLCSLIGFTALYYWMLQLCIRFKLIELRHSIRGI